MSIISINPANNQLIRKFQPLSCEHTLQAIDRAHRAFGEWRGSSFATRKAAMLKFAGLLCERTEEYAKLITLEMGKQIKESRREIRFCARIAEFYANGGEEFLSERLINAMNADAYIKNTPVGVLFGVMPWNFPFYRVTRFATPNIMAGNTILVRHADSVPQCAEAIGNLFCECGLPEGVYTNLFIPSELSSAVITHKHIAGVSLARSGVAGAAVSSDAGKNPKRSLMKLSDPMDESIDVGSLSPMDAAECLKKQGMETVDAEATVTLRGKRPNHQPAHEFAGRPPIWCNEKLWLRQ